MSWDSLVETIPVLIWSATPEGEPSYVNRQLTDYAGVTLRTWTSRAAHDWRAPRDQRIPEDSGRDNAVKHSFSTGEPFAAVLSNPALRRSVSLGR